MVKNLIDNKFSFLIHAIDLDDVFRKLGFLRPFPPRVVEGLIRRLPPFKISSITGIETPYAKTEGSFVSVPLTTRQMLTLPETFVLKRIIQAGRVAEKHGARIIGLGAMTSVVGDAGVTVAKNLNAAVTTGNTYTVATALQGLCRAAEIMGNSIEEAEVTIVGATGSIGSVCARLLARDATSMTLFARDHRKLDRLAETILDETGLSVSVTSNISRALEKADLIVAVSASADALIQPDDLKPGAVICDVARPRDVSVKVAEARDDVLVIEGGVVEIPGDVDFHFNFGFPARTAYACMAETMILALEGRFENYSLGRELSLEKVEEISSLAKKHGFRLAGFRSFEHSITEEEILKVKANAARKRGASQTGSKARRKAIAVK